MIRVFRRDDPKLDGEPEIEPVPADLFTGDVLAADNENHDHEEEHPDPHPPTDPDDE